MRILASNYFCIFVGLLALTILPGNVDGISCYQCTTRANEGCGASVASKNYLKKCDDGVTSCYFAEHKAKDGTLIGYHRKCNTFTDGSVSGCTEGTDHDGIHKECYCKSDGCNSIGNSNSGNSNSALRHIRSSLGLATQIGLPITVMVVSFWLF